MDLNALRQMMNAGGIPSLSGPKPVVAPGASRGDPGQKTAEERAAAMQLAQDQATYQQKLASLQQTSSADEAKYQQGLAPLHGQVEAMQQAIKMGYGGPDAEANLQRAMEAEQAFTDANDPHTQAKLDEFSTNNDPSGAKATGIRQKTTADRNKSESDKNKYKGELDTARHNQALADDRYGKESKTYEESKAAYDKALATSDKYKADKTQQDADIAADKFGVDPYKYLTSGQHTDAEKQDLSDKRLVKGDLTPDMGIEDLGPAPEDPGAAPVAPTHTQVDMPTMPAGVDFRTGLGGNAALTGLTGKFSSPSSVIENITNRVNGAGTAAGSLTKARPGTRNPLAAPPPAQLPPSPPPPAAAPPPAEAPPAAPPPPTNTAGTAPAVQASTAPPIANKPYSLYTPGSQSMPQATPTALNPRTSSPGTAQQGNGSTPNQAGQDKADPTPQATPNSLLAAGGGKLPFAPAKKKQDDDPTEIF